MASRTAQTGSREFDICVIGTTGVAGRRVVKRVQELSVEQNLGWRIAVAGRDQKRTRDVLSSVGVDWDSVAFVKVDATQVETIHEAVSQARLVINCSGPYRFFGPPIVASCVRARTHYIDISGEPEFIERMVAEHGAAAAANNVLVVSACGFDSIPADMGTLFTMEEFARAGGVASAVESFIQLEAPVPYVANATTWDCAVHGLGNVGRLKALRKASPRVNVPRRGGRLPRTSWPRRVPAVNNGFALPFMGSDASIVRRSMQHFSTPEHELPANVLPVQFAAYFIIQSRFNVLLCMIMGFLLMFLAKFKFGRALLLRYPRLFSFGAFSRAGPTEEAMRAARFHMTFLARGHRSADAKKPGDGAALARLRPDCSMVTKVSGPDPGYIGTAAIVSSVAATVLLDMFPKQGAGKGRCGVLTTAAAFHDTRLKERLMAEGVTFSVVKALH